MKKKTIAPEEPKFLVIKRLGCSDIITLSELKQHIHDYGVSNIAYVLEFKPVEIETIVSVGDE